MSDIMTEADITATVEKATSEDEFDVLAFFSGATLPEAEVTVYADSAAAYRLVEIMQAEKERAERSKTEGLSLADDDDYTDENEVDELTARLKASAVIFSLRGLAPAARAAIEKKARASNPYVEGAENTEYNEDYNGNLIAKTIVSVRNAKGQTDKHTWDAARVLKFAETVEPSQFDKLYVGAFRVNFLGDAIDQAVNADFS